MNTMRFAFVLTVTAMPTQGLPPPMHVHAQGRVVYRIKEKKWIAEKNVQWTQGSNTIKADHASVVIHPNTRAVQSIHATGHVTICMDQGTARCHALTYDGHHKTIVLQGNDAHNAVFATEKDTISSAQFKIFLQRGAQNDQTRWRIDRIVSCHPVRLTSPDTQLMGNQGVYHHKKNTAFIKGDVRIMHNKNYIETDDVVIDTKKKCYVIHDGHIQSLVDTKTEKKDKP